VGYDPVFGARPLKRAIQRMVENPLALQMLAGNFREGDKLTVEATRDGDLAFHREERKSQAA
jgi:ATP-dependent Clp protease ATP-binding subunit ClpB